MVEQASPVSEVDVIHGVRIFMKRDDLLHPHYGGNKWRKLKDNLGAMRARGLRALVTFGGPFSNHIYASAAFARTFGLHGTALIRGGVDDPRNPVLNFARDCGMEIVGMSRRDYARRANADFLTALQRRFPGTWIIPEGGDNDQGSSGCTGIVREVEHQLGFLPSRWIVPVGTGCTARGVARALEGRAVLHAVACVQEKHLVNYMGRAILEDANGYVPDNRFTFGGLARWNADLVETMHAFEWRYAIPLDPLYTAKAWYGLLFMIARGEISAGESVLFLHTGGMAGRMAFSYRYRGVLREPPAVQSSQ